jgi:hypothetical protein
VSSPPLPSPSLSLSLSRPPPLSSSLRTPCSPAAAARRRPPSPRPRARRLTRAHRRLARAPRPRAPRPRVRRPGAPRPPARPRPALLPRWLSPTAPASSPLRIRAPAALALARPTTPRSRAPGTRSVFARATVWRGVLTFSLIHF